MNNLVVLSIKTRNKERLLNQIYKLNINIINIKIIKYNEIELTIEEYDVDKIKKISILNEVDIKDYKGVKNIVNKIKFYYIFFICLIIGIILLFVLSNIIFKVDVISTNSKLKENMYEILEKEGIRAYTFKKSSEKLNEITNKILDNNKNIEWLSIKSNGTSYIVNVLERKVYDKSSNNTCTDVISKYNATIKKIHVYNGEKILDVNDYVYSGDVIVSGSVKFNDIVKNSYASASIYGEVWKRVSVSYDMNYISSTKSLIGNRFVVNIINSYEDYIKEHVFIIKNNIIPIYIGIDKLYKKEDDFGVYTESEYVNNALYLTYEYMSKNLEKDEYIISDKLLKYSINSNKIYLEVFYKLYLNIGIEREFIC